MVDESDRQMMETAFEAIKAQTESANAEFDSPVGSRKGHA